MKRYPIPAMKLLQERVKERRRGNPAKKKPSPLKKTTKLTIRIAPQIPVQNPPSKLNIHTIKRKARQNEVEQ
jgi:hypothetical protein